MIQTATDFFVPAQSKPEAQKGVSKNVAKDVSSLPSGFAKVLEAEGLRIEEQPAQSVVVVELPIEPELDVPDIARFPTSIFELIGTAETPEEEPEDVEEIAAPELNVIAYIAYAPAPEQPPVNEKHADEDESEPAAREKFSPVNVKYVPRENREIEILPTNEGDEETPIEFSEASELSQKEQPVNIETKRDEPANVNEPVVRNSEPRTEPIERAEPVIVAEAPKIVEPLKKTEKRASSVKIETHEKAEAHEKAKVIEKAEAPEKIGEPKKAEISEKIEALEKAQTLEKLELEKPIPREREEALEKMPPERKAAFADFLTNIAETRNAQKPEGVSQQAPVPRAQPMYQLLSTGRAAFTESLESVVRFARSEGIDRATLIIDPPALGKVSVEIISTAKGVEASLKVSSEQVRALVQDQIVQLKHALAQIGVQTAEFSVDVQQQDKQNEQAWQQQNQKLKNRANAADKEDETQDEEVFRVDLRKGLLHWVA